MGLYFTSINSGSNGNCYYVGNQDEAVLIDVGLTCKEVEKRMMRLGLSIHKVKAVFISHEHSDHIKGLSVFAKKYNLPVYISTPTLKSSKLLLNEGVTYPIGHTQSFNIGNLKVLAFSKFHDAADPYSFTVEYNGIRVGVFTDIGAVCDRLINQFRTCHAAFLESNYCTQMLANGNYPYFLKRRITSGHGHLSNTQALELFQNHKPEFMSHLLLSHLSKDNNDPLLVEELFKKVAGNTLIKVASRYEETELYYVGQETSGFKTYEFNPYSHQANQLNLF
ncbi:MBL fold metallo-hydrolase [Pedobacter sp. BMA]|uniref:MBL fold metallo-hydrolase n=1 Tax=Pedobacter sp. BMA TaxID=1663685 RepID=UPI00064AB203|nr:MBL fold metallo-hydrolase [Pedobacter sp. BMA]KLT66967.1 metallo-beta-lactamase [Pedobacter sp. BMA]